MLAKVIAPSANLYSSPTTRTLETQILFGETFLIEEEQNGWVKGRCETDSYEGFMRQENLRPRRDGVATHLVCAPSTCLYPASDVKALPVMALPMGARVVVLDFAGIFARTPEGFIPQKHLRALDNLSAAREPFVEAALALLGAPYVWGGRDSTKGIDCSALCQLALGVVGINCPRNSGAQEKQLGTAVEKGARLQHGDFIFWQAHVGILLDERGGAQTLLHANAFHMAVASEPLARALVRIESVAGPVRAIKRLS